MPAAPFPAPVVRRAPVAGARWPRRLGLLVLLAVIASPATVQDNDPLFNIRSMLRFEL